MSLNVPCVQYFPVDNTNRNVSRWPKRFRFEAIRVCDIGISIHSLRVYFCNCVVQSGGEHFIEVPEFTPSANDVRGKYETGSR